MSRMRTLGRFHVAGRQLINTNRIASPCDRSFSQQIRKPWHFRTKVLIRVQIVDADGVPSGLECGIKCHYVLRIKVWRIKTLDLRHRSRGYSGNLWSRWRKPEIL